MEFLYISPEFPAYGAHFIRNLTGLGMNVYGVGEADFYEMPETLRRDLKWYLRTDLGNTAAVKAAVDELLMIKLSSGSPPGFDLVESHNEQWLRPESFINSTYGIAGITAEDVDRVKKKSVMKGLFRTTGLTVASGQCVSGADHALDLAKNLGYPVILKPDEGVGARGIHKVADEDQLRRLLAEIREEYLLEEFIDAPIVTYDGLTDQNGHIIFENSLTYGDGVLDYVMGKDTFFYVNRVISDELSATGRKLARVFNIRRKFFHFEFFRRDGVYLPIEINCRPPGGAILDMMNYSIDDDLYAAYARMIVSGRAAVCETKKYFCCYLGRRDRNYRHDHGEIMSAFGSNLMDWAENPPLFHEAMGRYRYILRSPQESDMFRMAEFILQTH
jgi:ATP-grasp domain